MWPQTTPLGHPAGAPTPATDGFGSLVCVRDLGGNRSSPARRVDGLASQLVQSPNRPSRPHVGTSNPKSLQLLYRVFVCVSESDEWVDRSPAGSGRRGASDPVSRHSQHAHSYSRGPGGVGATGGEAPTEKKHTSRAAVRTPRSNPKDPGAALLYRHHMCILRHLQLKQILLDHEVHPYFSITQSQLDVPVAR
jgi:hypothetical protein